MVAWPEVLHLYRVQVGQGDTYMEDEGMKLPHLVPQLHVAWSLFDLLQNKHSAAA